MSVYKLIEHSSAEECTWNVQEVKIAGENECVCSYKICIIFALIVLGISIEIGAYFVYSRWYIKKILLVLSLTSVLKQQLNKLINGKSQTNRDKKPDLLFL